jgi:predicted transcriptional regulator
LRLWVDEAGRPRDIRDRLSYMTAKTVTRSIRFDEATNAELEALAGAAGKSVSEYIRDVIAEVAARESRVAAHKRAMAIFASLPPADDPDSARDEMWGIGTRVPR